MLAGRRPVDAEMALMLGDVFGVAPERFVLSNARHAHGGADRVPFHQASNYLSAASAV